MMMQLEKRRAVLILVSLIVPFACLRLALFLSPNSDFSVAGFNIHHLYTGLLLITLGGVPLALFSGTSRLLDGSAVVFGVGLSLALDEWVYLIATDGSNASYLLPVSFWGGVVMVGFACVYVLVLVVVKGRRGNTT